MTERQHARLSTNRCPFCHDDVSIQGAGWVSCRSCQARHHDACWDELGICSSCGESVHLITPSAHAEPERLRAGLKGFVTPAVLLGLMLVRSTGLPTWVSVAMITLMVWVILHKLLSPVVTLDSAGLEYRTTLRSVRVRYEDVVESKLNSFTGHWTLHARKDDGGTRKVVVPFEELREQDRAKLRAALEGLPREASADLFTTIQPPSPQQGRSCG